MTDVRFSQTRHARLPAIAIVAAVAAVPGCHASTARSATSHPTAASPTATATSPTPAATGQATVRVTWSPTRTSAAPYPSSTTAPMLGSATSVTTHGKHAWLMVSVEHRSVPIAWPLHVTIRVMSASGFLNGLAISYGDGQKHVESQTAAACPATSATASPSPPKTDSRNLRVTYRRTGTFHIRVTANANQEECAPTRYPPETLTATVTVRVLPTH